MLTCQRHPNVRLATWYDQHKFFANTFTMRTVCPACEGEKMGRKIVREALGQKPFDPHGDTSNRI